MDLKKNKLLVLFISVLVISCSSNDDSLETIPEKTQPDKNLPDEEINIVLPTVLTDNVENIRNSVADYNGRVVSNGGEILSNKGFCWSTIPQPTINDEVISHGSGLGHYSARATDLSKGTTYYLRAFATNSAGTAYGEEVSFSTLNDSLMLIAQNVYEYAWHNLEDKLIYLITYDSNDNMTLSNFRLVAFSYAKKEVIQERAITQFSIHAGESVHSISRWDDQRELYISSRNTVSILDANNLNEIASISIPTAQNISSVRQENGLIFISYYDGVLSEDKIAVYDRNSLALLNNELEFAPNAGLLLVYKNMLDPDQIKCLSFPQFSNGRSYVEYTLNSNDGSFISWALGEVETEGSIIRDRDELDFFIMGKRGRIYSKSDRYSNKPLLTGENYFIDYRLSTDGKYLYGLQNINTIKKYSTSDFTVEKSYPVNVHGKNLFVDGDSLFIVHYNKWEPVKKVHMSVHKI